MRVSSDELSGAGDDLSVIRGALGTISAAHSINSKIKKIKPLPIELRRPSILRASGHTFEYVGYGPGNYSTALPQLQNRSLSEREEFLTQSQETSCGNVVYTGMNDKGDFYIGNTKIASASGQQTTFDIPIPTITGEDPNRLSIVADEVIVKERLLVEGGVSKQILSQFDGPVTFNENVRLANPNKSLTVVGTTNLNGKVNFNSNDNSTSTTTGAVVIDGGVGIGKSIHIGGDIVGNNTGFDVTGEFGGVPDIVGFGSITANKFYGDGAGLTNTGATLNEPPTGTQRVVLTDKTSGTMTTAATDSALTFNFDNNILSTTTFNGNLTGNVTGNVTGNADTATLATNVVGSANRILYNDGTNTTNTSANLTFNGTRLTTNNIIAQNIRISSSGSNEIDTASGNLVLDAASNTVQVTTNLAVSGNTASTNKSTGALTVTGGVGIGGKLHVGDDIIAFAASDINLKKDISPIQNALDMVNKLSGNTFTWNSKSDYRDTDDIGILAQEVEALGLPGTTQTRDNGVKAVRYDRLIPVLIEAVKELTAKVKSLESNK